MIVRVLEEGQYELDDAGSARLDTLDSVLEDALRTGDEDTFAAALDAVIGEVRASGRRLDPSAIVPSDLALPAPGATLAEVRSLLLDDGAAPDEPAS
ncbi:MAG TPA: hypothetical protein VND23_09640 [Acidimicrobiales bacterium]|nr:hypothetical protein [Acidimicrobiales bacterium]